MRRLPFEVIGQSETKSETKFGENNKRKRLITLNSGLPKFALLVARTSLGPKVQMKQKYRPEQRLANKSVKQTTGQL